MLVPLMLGDEMEVEVAEQSKERYMRGMELKKRKHKQIEIDSQAKERKKQEKKV